MDDWKLPNYAAAAGRDPENVNDDETLLAGHEHDESEDEENEAKGGLLGSRRSMKSSLWVILMTTATLAGRRILNGGFRESFSVLSASLPLDVRMLECDTC